MSDFSYSDGRLAQVNKKIKESLGLLEELEQTRLLSKGPLEKRAYEAKIADVKRLLEEADQEKIALESKRGILIASNLQSKTKRSRPKTSQRRTEELVDPKHSPSPITTSTEVDPIVVKSVTTLINQGKIEQKEMQETLNAIVRMLQAVQENQSELSSEIHHGVSQIQEAVKSDLSLQQKLEYTLPLVPMFLNYKIELSAENSVDLNAVWQELQNRWKSFVARANKSIWSLDVIRGYGEVLSNESNGLRNSDPLLIAQEKFKQSNGAFTQKLEYFRDLETKIDQSVANINILITARKESIDLIELEQGFLDDVVKLQSNLSLKTLYPQAELKRLIGLTETLQNNAHIAAGLIAIRQKAIKELSQIKRNMRLLLELLEQISSWFGQMATLSAI
ncbi:MAG: hypothetical protein HUU38_08200 [Anaerolineales bacterium]|nr:hypothetical protein [Anaerolineales bacterium]